MNVDREAQMLRAAQLYYYDNLTQGAIADRLSCTRWTVGRLLEEARESGIVTISVNHLGGVSKVFLIAVLGLCHIDLPQAAAL